MTHINNDFLNETIKAMNEAAETIKNLNEELLQYRAIGTILEIQNMAKKTGSEKQTLVNYEKILRDKLSDTAADIVTGSEEEFARWIDRLMQNNKKCDQYRKILNEIADTVTSIS